MGPYCSTSGILAFALGATALLQGCRAEPARIQKDEVSAQELRYFPPENLRLTKNTFFLWKEEVTAEQVATALKISRQIESLDARADETGQSKTDEEARLRPFQEEIAKIQPRLKEITEAILANETRIRAEQSKPESERDTALIRRLNEENHALSNERKLAEGRLAEIQDQSKPVQERIEQLEAELRQIEEQGIDAVMQLIEVVEYYPEQPSSVSFQFVHGRQISVEIRGWNLNDGRSASNFSTDDGTILGPTYREQGGIFSFTAVVYEGEEARTGVREAYCFRLNRVKYDKLNKAHFAGEFMKVAAPSHCDIAWTEPQKVELRRGRAKLSGTR